MVFVHCQAKPWPTHLSFFSNGPFITGLCDPFKDLIQDEGDIDHLLGVDLTSDEDPTKYIFTFHIILHGLTINVETKQLMR